MRTAGSVAAFCLGDSCVVCHRVRISGKIGGMNRELRIFFLAVGVPAVILTLAGARLVYIEWLRASHPPQPKMIRAIDEPPHLRPPPPPPPHFVQLFSEKYGMDGTRVLWVGGCLVGLMFLSLVSGGWLLAKAARRSRLEALRQTDFVSNVSHEFKTPLTAIRLCAELAQDDTLEPERRKKALTAVLTETQHLERLVLNALDFSRLEQKRCSYDMRRLNVSEIVREVFATFSTCSHDGILQVPEGECVATVDADALRQILVNLLKNAVKYAPGGKVEVKVAAEGACVRVSVADNGPGLSSDALRHAFDRFWRGDNSVTCETGGSGLGLAIARGLARGMGGELTAANRAGGGAVFTLELKA